MLDSKVTAITSGSRLRKKKLNLEPEGEAQLEQLRAEIDNLALLLLRVKEQCDRILGTADSVGDAIFYRSGEELKVAKGRRGAN